MQLVNIDKNKTDYLLSLIRGGNPMTASQQAALVLRLSGPAVMAQLSSIIMQYIDATMVGSLGANASASIGLVSTTTWLFGGQWIEAASPQWKVVRGGFAAVESG